MLKDQVKKVYPFGQGMSLKIENLLNTGGIFNLPVFLSGGILTLPVFQLSDVPSIQRWSASFAWYCKVLLPLSINVKFLSSAQGSLVEMWWFVMALVV